MNLRALFVALALFAALSGCQSRKEIGIPEHLLGVWTTAHPKYADRYFEIRNDGLILGQGGEDFVLYPIVDIDESHEGGSTLYTIVHLNHEGQRFTFAFYYDPANNGMLRFKNQQNIVWTKEKQ